MNKSIPFMVILSTLIGFAGFAAAETASVTLKATTEGSNVSGTASLEEIEGGLKITAEVSNAAPGNHGFHIHENGSCDDHGKAAGGHFNPDKVQHGLLTKDGFTGAHAGDLGNFEINADGTGKYEAVIPGLSLTSGNHNVMGKSFILHAKTDDFGQPTGNSGDRIACGIIEKK